MKLRMLNDTVLIRPDAEEYISDDPNVSRILKEGTIQLPDKYEGFFKKSPMKGEVITAGPECKMPFRTGERIIFCRFGGAPLTWNGEKLKILREYEILAKEEA